MRRSGVCNVLLVEPHEKSRDFFARCILSGAALNLVAVLNNASDALAYLGVTNPLVDVVLVSFHLPMVEALCLVRHSFNMQPPCRSLVLVGSDNEALALDGIAAGAQGLIRWDARQDEVVHAISKVRDGHAAVDPNMLLPIIGRLHADAAALFNASLVTTQSAATEPEREKLTPREHEVLLLLARGMSYKQIADALGRKIGTVQSFVKGLYKKLGASSGREALFEAARQGLISR